MNARQDLPGALLLHRLAREEGLFADPSGERPALVVVLRVAQGLARGVVVTILPDGGERYL